MARRKKLPPKGKIPPQLAAHTFDKKPQNINRAGIPKDAVELRKFISELAGQLIKVKVQGGKKGKEDEAEMTRMEHLILDWFESGNSKKQELLMAYAYGKPVETIQIETPKTIKVSIVNRKSKASSEEVE